MRAPPAGAGLVASGPGPANTSASTVPFADAIVRPLHDAQAYRDAAARSLPRTLWHVARLALLAALALTIAATFWLSSLWRDHVGPVLDSIPTVTIRRGVATVDAAQPWVRRVMRDGSGRDWLVILDTTGRTADFAHGERGLLLLRTELRFKSGSRRVDALPLSRIPDVKLGPRALKRAVLWRLLLVPPLLLLLALSWNLVAKTVQALLLAAWFGRGANAPPLRARMGVAAAALSAPVLLECLAWLLPLPAVLSLPGYIGLAAFYSAAGMRQLSDGD
jgi:hypothetical protein